MIFFDIITIGDNMKKVKIYKYKQFIKNFLLGLLAFASYFVLSLTESLPFELLNIDTASIPMVVKTIYLFAYEILIMAVIAIILHKKLLKDFNDIKKNHKNYYSKYFKVWLTGLMIMYLSNCFIVFALKGGMASNEEAIRSLLQVSPIYIYFSSIIFAPFVEELVFRQGIRNMVSNKYLFIIISGLIFGGLHVFSSITSYIDLLYIIPYASLGVVFAYMLVKTDNIFVSMGFHFLHNGLLINLQFLVLLLS